jgi:hypothetical protein
MTKTTPAARAEARKLAQVRKLTARLARMESFGRGDDPLAERLREQIATRLVGRCRECHRALSDPDSLAAGIGPECASKVA